MEIREPWSAQEAAITIWLEDGYGAYLTPCLLECLFARNVSFRGVIEEKSTGQPGAEAKDVETFPQGFQIEIEEFYYRKALQLDQFLNREDRYRVKIEWVNPAYSGTAPYENDVHVFRKATCKWAPQCEENGVAAVKLSFTAEEMDPTDDSESTMPVPKHNTTHYAGGTDPLTPADIGAADEVHTHTGVYAPISHTHAASDITAGIFDLARIPATLTGKDADTVDGKHAADFALAAHTHSLLYAPLAHASQHAADGDDPLTPADIGAAVASHTHTDKADRVSGAVAGDLAGLDAAGNLTDSGYGSSDFAAATHTHSQYQLTSEKNMGGGYAGLESTGKLPLSVIPDGISGAVTSVNTQTGAVVLDAADVGADPSGSSAAVQDNLDTHAGNTSNPHAVTATQTGAVAMPSGFAPGSLVMGDDTGTPSNLAAPPMPMSGGPMVLEGQDITTPRPHWFQLGTAATAASTDFAAASALTGKADKILSPTNGDFVSVDAGGNIADSGLKAADFVTPAVPGHSGNLAGLDSTGHLTDSQITAAVGLSNPDRWKIAVGDGSGWKGHFAKYDGTTWTPLFTFADSGRLGIGTDPATPLHINADTSVEHVRVSYSADPRYYHSIVPRFAADPQYSYLQININNGIASTQITPLTIAGNGRVGICTATPNRALHVHATDSDAGLPSSSGAVSKGIAAFECEGEALVVGLNSASPYSLWLQGQNMSASGTTRPLTLQPNGGNVGIGPRLAATPSYFGYSTAYRTLILGSTGTTFSSDAVTISFGCDVSANTNGGFSGDGSELIFRPTTVFKQPVGTTDWRTPLTLVNGSVAVGPLNTTIPVAESKFRVVGDATTPNGAATFYRADLAGSNSHILYGTTGDWYIRSSLATGNVYIQDQGGNTIVGSAFFLNSYGNGTLSVSGGMVVSSSDERLKDIKGQFTKGLSELRKISPIIYRWNEASKIPCDCDIVGFGAGAIQKLIPEAVGKNSEGYLSLDDKPLIAVAINGVKELADMVDALTERVRALEARN